MPPFAIHLKTLNGATVVATTTKPEDYTQLQCQISQLEPTSAGILVAQTVEGAFITPEAFPLIDDCVIVREIFYADALHVESLPTTWENDAYLQHKKSEHDKLLSIPKRAKATRQDLRS